MLLGKMGGFGPDTLMADLPFHVMGFKRLSRGLLEFLCLAADLLFQSVHVLAAFAGSLFEFVLNFFLDLFHVFHTAYSFPSVSRGTPVSVLGLYS